MANNDISGEALFSILKSIVNVSVATLEDLHNIPTFRRTWGMSAAVYDDTLNNGIYILQKKNSDISDNNNWFSVHGVSSEISHYISSKFLFSILEERVDISVATIAQRDQIETYRRKWGMIVSVYEDGINSGIYYLKRNKNSDVLGDDNWEKILDASEKQHRIDDPEYHTPVDEPDKGKFLQTHPETGKIIFVDVVSGDKHFIYNVVFQEEALINHNLGKYPSVQIKGEDNRKVIADIEYIDENNLKLNFLYPFNGLVIMN